MSDDKLHKLLKFDETDLNANRSGRLTSRQNQAVSKWEQVDNTISLGITLVLLVLGVVFTYTPISQLLKHALSPAGLTGADTQGLLLSGIVWLVLGLSALGSFIRAFKKLNRAVLKTQGKISFVKVEERVENRDSNGHSSYSHTNVSYDLHVGEQNFAGVDQELMNVMQAGDTYTVYYVAGYGILSVELAANGK
jgi:hypothetical protein